MQLQTKLPQSLPKFGKESFSFRSLLESHDEIIRPAHYDHIALRLLLPPSLNPQVKYIVKIDVCQKGADTPPLYRTHLTLYLLPLFQRSRLQPFLDEAYDASIPYAVLDKLYQPLMVEGIKENPVHRSPQTPPPPLAERSYLPTSVFRSTVVLRLASVCRLLELDWPGTPLSSADEKDPEVFPPVGFQIILTESFALN